jgi:hypothetical protein
MALVFEHELLHEGAEVRNGETTGSASSATIAIRYVMTGVELEQAPDSRRD